jgi:hypothetical protein
VSAAPSSRREVTSPAAEVAHERGPAELAPVLDGAFAPRRVLQTGVAGLLAWSATVGPVLLARSSPASARLLALAALAGALGGPAFLWLRPLGSEACDRVARHLGITLFLAAATLAWWADGGRSVDALRGSVGALAWFAYALAWRDGWDMQPRASDADRLEARAALPRLAVPIGTLAGVGALAMMVIAWFVPGRERSLAAHVIGIACAVASVSTGANVVTGTLRRGRQTGRAGRWVLLLLVVAGATTYLVMR